METQAISPDAVAIATRVMLSLTGRRWTWPRRRAVEQYWVPDTAGGILHLAGRPATRIVSATGYSGTAYTDYSLYDGFRLYLPELERCLGWFYGYPSYDANGGVYPAAWRRRRGTPVTVTYVYGSPPPIDVKRAIDQLAAELDLMWSGQNCALPERVTSVSREGVTWTVLDPQQFLENGRTGLYFPDLVIGMYGKAKVRARVFSPEHLPPRRISSTLEP